MKARICWTIGEHEDSIVIDADSLEEIQSKAREIIVEREPDNYWSEMLD
jgi:hypothetical protein